MPELDVKTLTTKAVDLAREEYRHSNTIEIDDGETVISDVLPDGIWVRAWVWVEGEDITGDSPYAPLLLQPVTRHIT